ncbi:MAG: glycosyltransferase [Clostridia bacterium]|nr:glycosyltransferase [Clostridia bacterium]
MKKVAVIGHFAYGLEYLDGQTVKTKNVTNELRKTYSDEDVVCFDTHGGVKTLIKAPWYVFKALHDSKNVMILPAHNGLRVFGRLLPCFKRFFKNRKIFYAVIGGWLPQKLKKELSLARALRRFDGIYVETNTMKNDLVKQGFENVYVVPNFKELTAVCEDQLVYRNDPPYKLCTFSRVMKEKGIETAVDVIRKVNDELGYQAYSLDIYGQIDPGQTEWFENLTKKFDDVVRYCGFIDSQKSVECLKDYFALLFPTHFYTEGIPGTVIDAYAAGIPVISAKWQSFVDVVDDGVTGIGYEFDDTKDLEQKLIAVANTPSIMNDMKITCLKKSNSYMPCVAMKTIINGFV